MTTKEDVIELIKGLPKNTTIDDIIEELYFKMQVDEGLEKLDKNKGIPHSEVKNRPCKWIKKP